MTNFTDFNLAAPILKALQVKNYVTPTPIQSQAIPVVMTGRDLLGIAQTGTGKTAAFALPILDHLLKNPKRAQPKGCRVLVLSPTRELASQIAESFRDYSRGTKLSVTTIFGGVSANPQIRSLQQGVDVIVATPGRLLDHMQTRAAVLKDVEILVLDEADQMLDLGFVKPIRTIVKSLPDRRQTLFFSATMPREIATLAQEFLHKPAEVKVTPVSSTVERINQRVIHIEARKKRALLTEILATPDMTRALVFTRTKRGADKVARHLETAGVKAAAIHGNKSQNQREKALALFRAGNIDVLVATDIAARGIDIDSVTHVVNFELPEVPEAYVHRIGRTARAGKSGSAIALCDPAERDLLRSIERLTAQQIPSEDRRNDDKLEVEAKEPPRPRGRKPTAERRGGSRPTGSARPARDGETNAAAASRRRRKPAAAANGAAAHGAPADGTSAKLHTGSAGPAGAAAPAKKRKPHHRGAKPGGAGDTPRGASNGGAGGGGAKGANGTGGNAGGGNRTGAGPRRNSRGGKPAHRSGSGGNRAPAAARS